MTMRIGLAALALFTAATQAQIVPADRAGSEGRWVASWATAPQDYAAIPQGSGLPTLKLPRPTERFGLRSHRQRFFATLGGERVRVRFSNRFGKQPLKVLHASIGLHTGADAVSPASLRRLRFSGQVATTIAPGAEVWSDASPLGVEAGQAVAVSFRIDASVPFATVHRLPHEPGVSVSGDAVMRAAWTAGQPSAWNHVVTGMDVSMVVPARVLVAFGDSLTAGAGVDENAPLPMRYPDRLAALLRTRSGDGKSLQVGVLNAGIAGNRLLADMMGPRGLDRFETDVLGQSGVTHVLILIGINDIGFGAANPAGSSALNAAASWLQPGAPSIEQLTQGLQSVIGQARARGVKVLLGTLMPFKGAAYWSEDKEARRQALNRWIRGRQDIDAVVDFDAALRSASDPERLEPRYDSGDHLHPGNAGYAAMADAVDPKELAE